MTRLPRLLLPLAVCLVAAVPSSPATAATHYPSVAKAAPMALGVGDTLTVSGHWFRSGTGRNTVVFKRDGGRSVFVKAGKATSRTITVKIPPKMLTSLAHRSGKPVNTRFRLRVLAGRLGRSFTAAKLSPVIGAVALQPKITPDDCDGDGIPNSKDLDDDGDLLPDTLEATLKTDPCKADTDGDGMTDGWEYESALDYNSHAKPYAGKRPYPNALDGSDAAVDSDGDGMTNGQEYAAWAAFGGNRFPLNYSGGDPATGGKQAPPAGGAWMDRDHNGFLSDNERDADGDGIPNQDEDLIDGFAADKVTPLDKNGRTLGVFSLTHIERQDVRAIVDVVPLYGPLTHTHKVLPLNWLDADSDGDGIPDGADDQDGDNVSNLDELVAEVNAKGTSEELPINACAPHLEARLCLGDEDTDGDGIVNSQDADDDGDRIPDVVERALGTNPYLKDTDGDGVGDGFEYYSALDLNRSATPSATVKRAYPNPLDATDANTDFDGDGLTLSDEFRAWVFSGSPTPLNYSDGNQRTAGAGSPTDDLRDADGDGLSNWDEAHGRMTPQWWQDMFSGTSSPAPAAPAAATPTGTTGATGATGATGPAGPVTAPAYTESVYPSRTYAGTQLDNPDSDGDGILDGADDEDGDGFTNAFELARPEDWRASYVSTTHDGDNPKARVNPFNPCKPYYSSACHRYPPAGAYAGGEDWASPVHEDGP